MKQYRLSKWLKIITTMHEISTYVQYSKSLDTYIYIIIFMRKTVRSSHNVRVTQLILDEFGYNVFIIC